MVTKSKIDGTKGALSGLSFTDKEEKNIPSKEPEKLGSKEEKSKRSYSLPKSTITKLAELKLYDYPEGTSLEDIVNEAILKLYDMKHKKV